MTMMGLCYHYEHQTSCLAAQMFKTQALTSSLVIVVIVNHLLTIVASLMIICMTLAIVDTTLGVIAGQVHICLQHFS